MARKKLKCFYQNTRGLNTKIARGLRNKITLRNYDIVCLTETWLDDKTDSESLFDETYITYRSDRVIATHTRVLDPSYDGEFTGGGALIAVKKDIVTNRVKQWEAGIPFDNIWIKISTNGTKKIFMNNIYINHGTNFDRLNTYLQRLSEIINIHEPDAHFIIVGDFNLSCIEWFRLNDRCIALDSQGRLADELLNTITFTGLSQVNYVKNEYNRILDLVLTNMSNIKTKRVDGIVNEDLHHPAFVTEISTDKIKFMKSKRGPKFNFFNADYEAINRKIEQTD